MGRVEAFFSVLEVLAAALPSSQLRGSQLSKFGSSLLSCPFDR